MIKKMNIDKIFKNRNFKKFFFSSLISQFGSVFINFAASLFVLKITGSAMLMSLYFGISYLIMIVASPLLAPFVDRFNKVKILYILDFIFGLTDILLGVLLFILKDSTTIMIYFFVNAFINALITSIYQPTYNSMIPLIVEEGDLSRAYSLFSTIGNFNRIVGVLAASAIFSIFGYKWLLILNGLSFFFASYLEWTIKIQYQKTVSDNRFIEDLKEGFTYIKTKKSIISLIKLAIMMNFFLVGIFNIFIPYMFYNQLKLNPIYLAVVQVSLCLGGITMSVYLSKMKSKYSTGMKVIIGFVAFALLVIGITTNYIIYSAVNNFYIFIVSMVILFFSFGITTIYIQVPINLVYATTIDKEMMGRVMSIRSSLSMFAVPLSSFLVGYSIDNFNLFVVAIGLSIGISIVALITLKNKTIRSL